MASFSVIDENSDMVCQVPSLSQITISVNNTIDEYYF